VTRKTPGAGQERGREAPRSVNQGWGADGGAGQEVTPDGAAAMIRGQRRAVRDAPKKFANRKRKPFWRE
jgi:hypothetical protein